MYTVNNAVFTSFMAAVRFAQPIRANVVEVATGLQRWCPAPAKKRGMQHVLVNKDGTETPFTKIK